MDSATLCIEASYIVPADRAQGRGDGNRSGRMQAQQAPLVAQPS